MVTILSVSGIIISLFMLMIIDILSTNWNEEFEENLVYAKQETPSIFKSLSNHSTLARNIRIDQIKRVKGKG